MFSITFDAIEKKRANQPTKEMNLNTILKNNLRFFYFIRVDEQKMKYFLLFHIVFIISIFIILFTAEGIQITLLNLTTLSKFIMAFNITQTLLFAIESYMNIDKIEQTHDEFQNIVKLLETQSNQRNSISFSHFQRKFVVNTFVCFIIYFIKCYGQIIPFANILDIILELCGFFQLFRKCLSIFYIELIYFLYNKLCEGIAIKKCENNKKSIKRNENASEQYRLCKLIYFKLWIASNGIEKHFGWTLFLSCLNEFMFSTYSLFLLFVQWHLHSGPNQFFRM